MILTNVIIEYIPHSLSTLEKKNSDEIKQTLLSGMCKIGDPVIAVRKPVNEIDTDYIFFPLNDWPVIIG